MGNSRRLRSNRINRSHSGRPVHGIRFIRIEWSTTDGETTLNFHFPFCSFHCVSAHGLNHFKLNRYPFCFPSILFLLFCNKFAKRLEPMLLSHFMIKCRGFSELKITICHICRSVMESKASVPMNGSVAEMT